MPFSALGVDDGELRVADCDHLFSFRVTKEKHWPYEYCIHVDGFCPKNSSYMNFTFWDQEDDSYELNIVSGSRKDHTVRYSSDKPNIKQISFCYR